MSKMLGVPAWALPIWLRSHPHNRTTVMRASGSILFASAAGRGLPHQAAPAVAAVSPGVTSLKSP